MFTFQTSKGVVRDVEDEVVFDVEGVIRCY